MSRIVYTKPSITEIEVDLVTDAARNGWGAQCYDYINRFERDLADFVGTRFAVATSSCTGAIEMGLAALGIGPDDEVILADTNWIATVAPVMHLKATPVFVDILPDSWCLDPDLVAQAITGKTRAIIATHLYGNLCDMDALRTLAEANNLALVEDSAEALGARWGGAHTGSMGTFGTFSFHGTKTMTTGEGGAFVTNDEALYARVSTLANHGRDKTQSKQFWADVVGYKFKMSNIQAALGCGQLSRIDQLTARKHDILSAYKERLLQLTGVTMNPEPANTRIGAWMPTAVFDAELGITREALLDAFEAANIDARVFFYPLSEQPMFEAAQTPQSHDICRRAINLPSFHDITEAEIDRVCRVVENMVAHPG